ncbi:MULTISPECIES: O-antigen ligase family protein [unclassified Bacillus (in: firmicutes)]|uniref:O-antigen ligase family protein n=1 Tax=unclassified Bacillus (in: firmicutes) TaxID=185979 RepID=UPI0030FA43AE
MKKNALLDVTLTYYYVLLFFIYIPTNGDDTHWIPRPFGYYLAMSLPLFFIFFLIFKRRISYYKEITVAMFLLSILFAFCALSGFWSSISFETLWRSCQTFIPILALALLIMNVKDSQTFFVKILKINVLISMFLSVIAITIKVFGSTYWLKNEISVNFISVFGVTINQYLYKFDTYFRYSSITGNPNLFGWILVLGIASACILHFSKNLKKWNFFFIFLIQCYSLYLSSSRTSILISFIFITLFYLAKTKTPFMHKKNVFKNITIASILLAALASFYLFSSSDKKTVSLSGRNDIWDILLNEFASHPLNGVGFNTTQELLLSSGVDENVISGGAHSFYIGFMTETGLIGMLLFFVFAVYSISLLLKQRITTNANYHQQIISKGSLCLLIVLLIHQCTEFYLLRNNYFNYVWFFMLFSTLKFHFDLNQKAHD